jgi:hypothetical protein
MRPPRVCLGLVEVSGVLIRLKRGFDELGIDAVVIDLEPSPFDYGVDDLDSVPRIVPWIRRMRRLERRLSGRGLPLRIAVRVAELPLRGLLFIWALGRFDVFVLGYRSTFLFFVDYPIMRLLGKRIIAVFFGSDERPPYMDGYVAPGLTAQELARRTRLQALLVRIVGRWADVVVSGPGSGQFSRRPLVVYQVLGNPAERSPHVEPKGPIRRDGPTRVLHASSNLRAKGTARVREAVANVSNSGLELDYREVRGVTNRELQEMMADSDIVIDQAYGDTPYAMLPAEAALVGCPVIIGGYGWDQLRPYLPQNFVWPAVCHPDDLESTITALAKDPERRADLAAASRTFIETVWSPVEVARRYARLFEGDPPIDWMFDPATICSPYGNGVSRTELATNVAAVVSCRGVAGLQLDDKPRLRDSLLRIASPIDE